MPFLCDHRDQGAPAKARIEFATCAWKKTFHLLVWQSLLVLMRFAAASGVDLMR